MESRSVEMKQQHNLLMLKSPALQGQWTGAKLTLKKKKGLDTSSTHDGGKQNTKVGGTLQQTMYNNPEMFTAKPT